MKRWAPFYGVANFRGQVTFSAGRRCPWFYGTGALLDYLVETPPGYRFFRSAIDRACTRYVPGLVVAEVDYFLRDERPSRRSIGK